MKKFSKFYLIILVMFIISGLLARFFLNSTEEDVQEAELEAAATIPGYETMLHIQQVATEQQLQDALINIEVAQQGELNSAVVHIQSNEYMTEEILLKDSYNMLTKLSNLEQLASVHFIWYKPVNNKNSVVLDFVLDNTMLNALSNYTYKDIPTIASSYVLY